MQIEDNRYKIIVYQKSYERPLKGIHSFFFLIREHEAAHRHMAYRVRSTDT